MADRNITTEDVPKSITINGHEIALDSGAKVWGGRYEKSAVWKFTSSEGAITHLSLSMAAMGAIVQLYQGMIGCDKEFAAVGFEPQPDDVGAKP